jgi:signal transduction histidine kinase/CHASE1-domain containing sensor protein
MKITKAHNTPYFKGWITLATWLAVATSALTLQIADEIYDQRQEFKQNSEYLYQLVRQRIDQNEAVIGGLEALFNTFPTLQFKDIRGYAHEMLERYPHIYTIEFQPRVELAKVKQFESKLSAQLHYPYTIKDFGFGGARNWHPSPPRPFYYPITFMEPPIEAASPVFGLDVFADSKFHDAISKTITTGKPTASSPFDLVEKGRGYLIFKAIFNPSDTPNAELRQSQATQIVSMLIHTDKFLRPEELPSHNFSMLIYHRSFKRDDADGYIDRIETAIKPTFFSGMLPVLTFSKAFSSESQPFVFETRRDLGWEVISIVPTLFVLISTLAITLLLTTVFNQRRAANLAAKDAAELLSLEKERAFSQDALEKQRRQHEGELAHVSRLNTMGEMASGIAHEINQPLTAILSYNQACIRMLQEEDADTAGILRAMQASAAQSKRAGEIIKHLREFVSKQTNPLAPVNLNQVILNVLLLADHELRDQQVDVTTDLDQSPSLVIADRIQLEQVVLNLVLNALEAMKDTPAENKKLSIETQVDGGTITLTIHDHGHGIPVETIDQLFNPFFTTKSTGMGLGLTISQSIIEAYGGRISASNASDGAIFKFILPIANAHSDDSMPKRSA